jgi:hypothetical protein
VSRSAAQDVEGQEIAGDVKWARTSLGFNCCVIFYCFRHMDAVLRDRLSDDSTQPGSISNNKAEPIPNRFTEINACSATATITPKVVDIKPLPNGSASAEERASAVEARTEFLEVMKDIESSAVAISSGEEM